MRGELDPFERHNLLEVSTYWLLSRDAKDDRDLTEALIRLLDSGKALDRLSRERESSKSGASPDSGEAPAPPDEIEIAFQMWLDDFPPFCELTAKAGTFYVLSLVGLLAMESAKPSSLLLLNTLLSRALVIAAKIYEVDSNRSMVASHGLKAGPKASAESRANRKAERIAKTLAAADDYRLKRNPSAGLEEIAAFLEERGHGKKSTIVKTLSGSKASFLNAMATRVQK